MSSRILIVDDDSLIVDLITIWLKKKFRGIEIDYTTSSESAIEYAKEVKYDLVIADVKMPIIDGMKMIKEINGNATTVIYISGNDMSDIEIDEFVDKIAKPFDFEELMSRIEAKLRFADMLKDMLETLKKTRKALQEYDERKRNRGWIRRIARGI